MSSSQAKTGGLMMMDHSTSILVHGASMILEAVI